MRRLGGVVAALAFLATTAVACGDSGPKGVAGRAVTTTEVPVPIAFTITSFDVEAAAPPVAGAVEGARAGVETTFERWLDDDVLTPLRSAQPPGDLRSLFTTVTGERAATAPDRAAFVSEGLPAVTGLAADTATLAVVALADPDGQIPIVTVHLELRLRGTADSTPLTVEHIGDLVLVPEGDGWKIDSYDVRATRDTAGTTSTTTATS